MILKSILFILGYFSYRVYALPTPSLIPSDKGLYEGGFFQGDIAGVDPLELNDRSATVKLHELWPNGIMYYKIDKSLEYFVDDILHAMKEYEGKTCIKFREATSQTVDYVNIGFMNGCWSKPGRRGGKQDLSLGDGCLNKGTIMHELGHALGFYHEQSRSDRDEYLEIIWDNIAAGQAPQFIKMKYFDNNLLGENFDYKSIMLYDETTFSKDGVSPTIRVLEPGIVIGPVFKKRFLSETDVNKVNKLYQCFGMTRPTPPLPPDMICDFEVDDCAIKNEYGSAAFERKLVTLGGRTSTVYLVDALTTTDVLVGLATPAYHLYGNKEGCFSFDYYVNGKGIYYFNVFKGSERLVESKEKSDEWKTYRIPIYEKDGEVRFYIGGSVFTRNNANGSLAVDNVSFKRTPCPSEE